MNEQGDLFKKPDQQQPQQPDLHELAAQIGAAADRSRKMRKEAGVEDEPSEAAIDQGHAGPLVERRRPKAQSMELPSGVSDIHTLDDPDGQRPAARDRHPSSGEGTAGQIQKHIADARKALGRERPPNSPQ